MNIAKERRDKDYFGNMISIETMLEHILNIAKENGLILSKEEGKILAQMALEIKYSDRIHNLKTQWDPNNVGKVRRKVRETIKYLLESAKKVNYDAYLQMYKLIIKLELELDKYNKKVNLIL